MALSLVILFIYVWWLTIDPSCGGLNASFFIGNSATSVVLIIVFVQAANLTVAPINVFGFI